MTSNSTTFKDFGAPVIAAAWLNDVNTTVYTALGDGSLNPPATPAQVLANIGAVGAASPTFTGTVTVNGNETVSGTLGVTGATTFGNTVGITGNTTLGGTLGVTGAATLASAGITGNATVGGTFGVTGQTTLGAATGVTPTVGDNSTKLATTAFLAASGAVPIPVGQCQLVYSTVTKIILLPFNGNKIMIQGAYQTVPSSGVSLTSPTMTTTTLYYIYAYMNVGVMTLEASTTTHVTDTTTGVEIKSGDNTRTLVGMVYCYSVANNFTNIASKRYVRTWFNDQGISGFAFFSTSRTWTTGVGEINSEIENAFLLWSGETPTLFFSGFVYPTTALGFVGAYPAIDGAQVDGGSLAQPSGLSNATNIAWSIPTPGLSEGKHIATLFGGVNAGTTGNYNGGASSGGTTPRCTLSTYFHK